MTNKRNKKSPLKHISPYRVTKSPNDNLWYVIGSCGGGYWMPISDGYKTKAIAQKNAKSYYRAEVAIANSDMSLEMSY